MNELVKFVVAIVMPTIAIWVWSIGTMSCTTQVLATDTARCSISISPNGLDIPFISFIFYAIFYGLSVLLSGYNIRKN